jgi:hypothetical protein
MTSASRARHSRSAIGPSRRVGDRLVPSAPRKERAHRGSRRGGRRARRGRRIGEHRYRRALRTGGCDLRLGGRGPDRRRLALLLITAVSTGDGRRAVARLVAGADRTARARAAIALADGAVAGYQVCFFTAVRMTGLAIGTVVAIGSAPVLTGLLTRLTGGPKLSRRWAVATAAAVAGCSVRVPAAGQPVSARRGCSWLSRRGPAARSTLSPRRG